MDYIEKLKRMDEHLEEHPKDYQTVIARMKTFSDAIEDERKQKVNERLKNVAKYRKERLEREKGK